MSTVTSPGRVRRIKVTILEVDKHDERVKLVSHTDGNSVKRYRLCEDEDISCYRPGRVTLELVEMRSGDRRVRRIGK